MTLNALEWEDMKKVKETVSTLDIFHAYFSEAKKYPWHIAIALVAAVGIQVAELAAPWYLRKIFNILATSAVNEATIHALFATLGMVAIMWISRWVAIEIRSVSIIRMESSAMKGLYASTFSYLIRHSHARHDLWRRTHVHRGPFRSDRISSVEEEWSLAIGVDSEPSSDTQPVV